MKEENETKYEMQLEALTENLSVLRQDFVSEQEKNEEVEKRVDELTGEKLGKVFAFIIPSLKILEYSNADFLLHFKILNFF